MNTGDQSLIKNINRRIILETMMEKGSISRIQLAKITGLNKATITSRISDLLKDGIVIETRQDKSTGGRKPILLSINHAAGYAIGIEMDVDYVRFLLTDLAGNIKIRHLEEVKGLSLDDTCRVLIRHIKQLIKSAPPSRYGIVGIGIGIHGVVDKDQKIVFATHTNWRNVNLKERLESIFKMPIYIDNNTNLCAFAEKTFFVEDSNIICITISTGIGLGIIIDDKVYRGYNGFAGEIGHMIIHEEGRLCSCGNRGCWEKYASEKAFLKELAVSKNMESCTLKDLKCWIRQKDPITLKCLSKLAKNLYLGINNVINIFNPETIILNGEIVSIYPKIIKDIEKNLKSSMNDYRRILPSQLGRDACSLGAAAVVIEKFLDLSNLKLINFKQRRI